MPPTFFFFRTPTKIILYNFIDKNPKLNASAGTFYDQEIYSSKENFQKFVMNEEDANEMEEELKQKKPSRFQYNAPQALIEKDMKSGKNKKYLISYFMHIINNKQKN